VIKLSQLLTASGIVLFYPDRLLTNQIRQWADRHGGCRTAVSFERTLPGIRKRLRRAELAVINATDNPEQASDAFLQSVGVLNADSVAVYTEKTHEGLEILVRSLGAPLLMGPMSMEEWEDYLDYKFPTLLRLDSSDAFARQSNRHTFQDIEESEENNVVYYKPKAG
jgi:hypothetical protein